MTFLRNVRVGKADVLVEGQYTSRATLIFAYLSWSGVTTLLRVWIPKIFLPVFTHFILINTLLSRDELVFLFAYHYHKMTQASVYKPLQQYKIVSEHKHRHTHTCITHCCSYAGYAGLLPVHEKAACCTYVSSISPRQPLKQKHLKWLSDNVASHLQFTKLTVSVCV